MLLAWQVALAGSDPFPGVADAYLVEINEVSLWQRNATQKLPPASLTKLMTAILVLENSPLDAPVSISKEAVKETGSRFGAKIHSKFTVESLLKAMLLASANDACHALAEHVAGSEQKFVVLMNARAKELRLLDTHYENACGHDAAGHYSSAKDLASLSYLLIKNPFVSAVTSGSSDEIASMDGKFHFRIANKNALVGRYEGVIGLKTGYTQKAGKCLIAYATRNINQQEKRVLLVMLNAPNRWWDAVDILDLAFANAFVNT